MEEISFDIFYKYLPEEKTKEAHKMGADVVIEKLKTSKNTFHLLSPKIDSFLEKHGLTLEWLGQHQRKPKYSTITAMRDKRLDAEKGAMILYWIFSEHPDLVADISTFLWGCSLEEHHLKEQENKLKIKK